MEYLLNLNKKFIGFLVKIALYCGWQIHYDKVDDCYDWVDHPLYIFGIYILHRKVLENNRIQFFKKTGYALYLTMFIAIGDSFLIIITSYIYGYMRFTQQLLRNEIIESLFYIINGIVVTSIFVRSPSYGICYEKLKDLHYEADKLLKQLHLAMDYSPIMILALFVQISVYGFLIICTSCGAYEFLFEDNNKFIVFYEYISMVVIAVSTMFAIIQHVGNLLICFVRGWMINQLLRKKIYGGNDDETEDDDIDEILLYKSRSINTLFQLIIDFHNKQNAIAKTTLDFTALTNFAIVFVYSVSNAFILYVYIYESIIVYKVFYAYIFFFMGIVLLTLSGQLFKWQAQETVNLISDWTICYLDEEFIQNKNSFLLQVLHDKSDGQYDGIIKVNNSLWITIAEITITLLVYIIQSFGAQLKNV